MKLSADGYYDFDLGPTHERLVGELYYPYEIEVRARNSAFVFGRFSIGLIGRLVVLSERPGEMTTLFRAGAFCEAHPSSKIIIGGEHGVSSILHNSWGVYGKLFSRTFSDEAKRCIRHEAHGVTLGDGVILSADCTVIDGVRIADGTVLAAGAVAVGACAPYSLYGGIPAKPIKRRLSAERIGMTEGFDLAHVRGHCLPDTPSILQRLERGQIGIDEARSAVDYMAEIPRIVFAGTLGSNNELVLGEIQAFQVGDRTISDAGQDRFLRGYFAQARAGRPGIKWSPDIFHAIGVS